MNLTTMDWYEKQLQNKETQISSLEAENSNLLIQLAARDEKIESLEAEIRLCEGQAWKQRLQLERCQNNQVKLQSALDRYQAEMGGWKGYARSLEKQIQESRSSIRFPGL